jgi:ribose 1,5-bisphosphokinase PhnN
MSNVELPSFQRAFVALSYVAGRRDATLLDAFASVHADTQLLAQRLANPERERRAEVLARELARVALSLEARGIK